MHRLEIESSASQMPIIWGDSQTQKKIEFIITAADILSPKGKQNVFAHFAKSGLLTDAINGFNGIIALLTFKDKGIFEETLMSDVWVTSYDQRVRQYVQSQIKWDNLKESFSQDEIEKFKINLQDYIISLGWSAVREFTRIEKTMNTHIEILRIKVKKKWQLSKKEFEEAYRTLHALLFSDVRSLQWMNIMENK